MFKYKNLIKNRAILFYLSLLAILLAFKLVMIFTSAAKFFDTEELYRGTIAKELISGLSQPIFDYQYFGQEGGTLVSGILAVLFFLLFGANIFALKLTAIFILALTFSAMFYFLNKYFGLFSAVAASLIFIFSPIEFTRRSLVLFGNHCESALFTILIIWLFFEIVFDETKKNKHYLFFALGFISGFGIYFDYLVGIAVFITFFGLFYFWRLALSFRKIIILIFGFVFGFTPWIYYNFTHHLRGIYIQGRALSSYVIGNPVGKIFENLRYFIFSYFKDFFSFYGFSIASDKVFLIIYIFIFLLTLFSLVASILKRKKDTFFLKRLIIFIYFALFCLIFGFFVPAGKVSRLCAIWPVIAVIIALGIMQINEKNKFAAGVIFFLVVFIGGVSNFNFITFGNPYCDYNAEGFSYSMYGFMFSEAARYDKILPLVTKQAEKLKNENRRDFINGFVKNSSRYCMPSEEYLKAYFALAGDYNFKERSEFFEYLGEGIGEGFGCHYSFIDENTFKGYQSIVSKLNNFSEEKKYFYYGLGTGLGKTYLDSDGNAEKLIKWAQGQEEEYFYRGLINAIAKAYCCNFNEIIEVVRRFKNLSVPYRQYAYEQLGFEVGLRFNGSAENLSRQICGGCDKELKDGFKLSLGLRPEEKTAILYLFSRVSDNDYSSNSCEPRGWSLNGRLSIVSLAKEIDTSDRHEFCRGIGRALGLVYAGSAGGK